MNPTTAADDAIVQEIPIHAPAARIFAALTDPNELLKWWAIEGKFRLVHAACDLRSGGKWIMRLAGSCGTGELESVVHGVYLMVEPPTCLSYTWIREGEDQPETLVHWDLDERDGVTTVRVTHSGLTSERLRQRNSGWGMIVNLLRDYFES